MGAKSEKNAENCTFFFVYVVYRNVGLINMGVIAGLPPVFHNVINSWEKHRRMEVNS